VAQALEKLHAADLSPIAGELAMHYQQASKWERAFEYYRRAAAVAQQLFAHREQVDYLQKAIAAAQALSSDGATTAAEIELWLELGSAQDLIHGWSSELAATAFQKADELAAQAGNVPYRCQALGALTMTAWNRGQWHKARELNELAGVLAQELGDENLVNDLSPGNGITLYHLGKFAKALATFRGHPAFSAEPVQLAHAWVNNKLTASMCLRIGKCLWSLGFPDQALAYCRQLLAVRSLQVDLLLRATGLVFAAIFYSFLRETQTVQMLAEELTAVSMEYDHPFFAMQGQMLRGWALAQRGDVEAGLPLVRMGIEDERRQSIRMYEPHSRALLAETLALAGEWEEAMDEVTEALAYAEECGNVFWNAHLLKLQGDYLQALSLPAAKAEACYRRAIAVAQRQGAKSLELRATTSLCRLWQQQGKQAEARQMLTEIYGWFTEGFTTVDLQEAKALLNEL
jgi:tetratricopeptide (TPR) repeat protein